METTTKRTVDQEKKQKKFCFQFINHLDGQRSQPFVSNWDQLRDILREREKGALPQDEDFILLVAVLGDQEETNIPATPLITVKSYLDMFDPTPGEEPSDQEEPTQTES